MNKLTFLYRKCKFILFGHWCAFWLSSLYFLYGYSFVEIYKQTLDEYTKVLLEEYRKAKWKQEYKTN